MGSQEVKLHDVDAEKFKLMILQHEGSAASLSETLGKLVHAPGCEICFVSSTSPMDLQTNVVINKTVAATFSKSIDPATVTTTNFTVTGPGSSRRGGNGEL